jgi:hypothetical protein
MTIDQIKSDIQRAREASQRLAEGLSSLQAAGAVAAYDYALELLSRYKAPPITRQRSLEELQGDREAAEMDMGKDFAINQD